MIRGAVRAAMLTAAAVVGHPVDAGGRGPVSACGGRGPAVTATTRKLGGVPYRLFSVTRPTRTILLFHGGPYAPALGPPDGLDCHLARRFDARVVKPAYYGSVERSAWSRPPVMTAGGPLTRAQVAELMLRAVDKVYAGMPRSVRELRVFARRFDGDRTTIVGESHGALLAVLAGSAAPRSAVVLLAPVIASKRSIVRAAMVGRYRLQDPVVETPRLVDDGMDVTDRVFRTPRERTRLMEAVSLAYYRPWEDLTLDRLLARTGVKARIIVGLRDRIGMIDLRDWRKFRRAVPAGTRLCADPRLAHEPPMASELARACLHRFMRLTPRPSIGLVTTPPR